MASPNSRTERQAPVPESILERQFVEPILAGAKENLQRDGSLMPVLFLRMQNGEAGIVPLVTAHPKMYQASSPKLRRAQLGQSAPRQLG